MSHYWRWLLAAMPLVCGSGSVAAYAQTGEEAALSPDARVDRLLADMTKEEKARLLFGYFGIDRPTQKYEAPAEARTGSAGVVLGIPRLGVPPQWQTDAGMGVATQGDTPVKLERTALPSGMAIAATWNPVLAYRGGAMIGDEARRSGYNVMLAGGVNLVRDPRNGRNFEYGGEDPLLAGTIVGSQVAGIESNKIISTLKHFAFNNLETGRDYHDARINPADARVSDLFAFQLAIERSDAGSIMCAYNRVNADYACENSWLLNDVLRRDWGWRGYVMSDWGATHSTVKAARSGLDQETGYPFDKEPYLREPLLEAVRSGQLPQAQLDVMSRRVLRTMIVKGLIDNPVRIAPIDLAAGAEVSRSGAEEGAVLLKNDSNLLPLLPSTKRIVVIGGHADRGVLSGGGSSQVYPVGGNAVPGVAPTTWPGPVVYYPNAPLGALRRSLPKTVEVDFIDGNDVAAAARAAAKADVAIIFATQWATESIDTSVKLSGNQDALITAVGSANPKTAVVLQTGGPVLMPWADKVSAILEAWYPGVAGGDAIADLLVGAVNPSGKLPVTFMADERQLPRPLMPGAGLAQGQMFGIDYSEGATVGYKWFDAKGLQPAFPFGHGLSYTSFGYDKLMVQANGPELTVRFRLSNLGRRGGQDVPQIYVGPTSGGWEAPKRLAGFTKVDLKPGASSEVSIRIDPRLLATWDEAGLRWTISAGTYRVSLARSSRDIVQEATVQVDAHTLPANWHP